MFALLAAAAMQTSPQEIVLTEGLGIASVGRYGRAVIHTDALEARLAAGETIEPKPGDAVGIPDGRSRTWSQIKAGSDGWFRGSEALSGGYVYLRYDSLADRDMVLEAAGHSLVYVNGRLRTGDPYSYGWLRLPVHIKQGKNSFLFQTGRGQLRAKIYETRAPLMLESADATLPDIIAGEPAPAYAGIVVVNATPIHRKSLAIISECGGKRETTWLPPISPSTIRKVPVRIQVPYNAQEGTLECRLTLTEDPSQPGSLDTTMVTLRVRNSNQSHKRTFISEIDGSVQYYAVQPALQTPNYPGKPALILSLHGASVEATGQADAYAPKLWAHIVAPTNRRPYGFDWEDWGRMDALEVLSLAKARYDTDLSRTYLTGHSMGGHGAWQVAAHYPGLFAAVGPSAGWISFSSYTGAGGYENPTDFERALMRASSASDTLLLSRNYTDLGIYILHGDADDNVPPTEARAMANELAAFHKDYTFFEKTGAGHWWDDSEEPGASCVDWPPMFDFFARRRIPDPASVRHVSFTTVNPGISSQYRWVGILQQEVMLAPSSVHISNEPLRRRFVGTTQNVAMLSINLSDIYSADRGKPATIEIDGQVLEASWPESGTIYLKKDGTAWRTSNAPSAKEKNPQRNGPFKEGMRSRFALVYGTHGTPEENAWSYEKARYDAETWYYRGNGSVDVVADVALSTISKDRSIVLYGNSDTNSAWATLLGDSPIQAKRNSVRLGKQAFRGSDLGCVFIRPRPGSAVACVMTVSGTGMSGFRLTNRLPFFVSGAGFPDYLLIGPEVLASGSKAIKSAGFFENDWSLR